MFVCAWGCNETTKGYTGLRRWRTQEQVTWEYNKEIREHTTTHPLKDTDKSHKHPKGGRGMKKSIVQEHRVCVCLHACRLCINMCGRCLLLLICSDLRSNTIRCEFSRLYIDMSPSAAAASAACLCVHTESIATQTLHTHFRGVITPSWSSVQLIN